MCSGGVEATRMVISGTSVFGAECGALNLPACQDDSDVPECLNQLPTGCGAYVASTKQVKVPQEEIMPCQGSETKHGSAIPLARVKEAAPPQFNACAMSSLGEETNAPLSNEACPLRAVSLQPSTDTAHECPNQTPDVGFTRVDFASVSDGDGYDFHIAYSHSLVPLDSEHEYLVHFFGDPSDTPGVLCGTTLRDGADVMVDWAVISTMVTQPSSTERDVEESIKYVTDDPDCTAVCGEINSGESFKRCLYQLPSKCTVKHTVSRRTTHGTICSLRKTAMVQMSTEDFPFPNDGYEVDRFKVDIQGYTSDTSNLYVCADADSMYSFCDKGFESCDFMPLVGGAEADFTTRPFNAKDISHVVISDSFVELPVEADGGPQYFVTEYASSPTEYKGRKVEKTFAFELEGELCDAAVPECEQVTSASEAEACMARQFAPECFGIGAEVAASYGVHGCRNSLRFDVPIGLAGEMAGIKVAAAMVDDCDLEVYATPTNWAAVDLCKIPGGDEPPLPVESIVYNAADSMIEIRLGKNVVPSGNFEDISLTVIANPKRGGMAGASGVICELVPDASGTMMFENSVRLGSAYPFDDSGLTFPPDMEWCAETAPDVCQDVGSYLDIKDCLESLQQTCEVEVKITAPVPAHSCYNHTMLMYSVDNDRRGLANRVILPYELTEPGCSVTLVGVTPSEMYDGCTISASHAQPALSETIYPEDLRVAIDFNLWVQPDFIFAVITDSDETKDCRFTYRGDLDDLDKGKIKAGLTYTQRRPGLVLDDGEKPTHAPDTTTKASTSTRPDISPDLAFATIAYSLLSLIALLFI